MIPPDADGEFVADREEVLETHEKAYNLACPAAFMDEPPVQLIGETRVPIPATPERGRGTASPFMFAEPLSGFRQATARPRRTKDDLAREVAQLRDTRHAGVERITLVCDNSNTHMKWALYEAFPAPWWSRRVGRWRSFSGPTPPQWNSHWTQTPSPYLQRILLHPPLAWPHKLSGVQPSSLVAMGQSG